MALHQKHAIGSLSMQQKRTRPVVRKNVQCLAKTEGPSPVDPSETVLPAQKRYTIDFTDLLEEAPRIRVKTISERQRNQLAELAVLNERLAGRDPVEIRKKVEFLKGKRRTWEAIYHYVTRSDAVATMASIEEARMQVEEALREQNWEAKSVADLRQELEQLNSQVAQAQSRLQVTQSRVQQNLDRVEALKEQAARLQRATELPGIPEASLEASTSTSVQQEAALAAAAAPSTAGGVQLAPQPAQQQQPSLNDSRRRGLHSSLEIEDGLRNFWYPSAFSSKLTPDTLVPFELFNETWVLFRDENGQPACVRDECAHRACPLSLGQVVDGRVECAYHGWQFDGHGNCTKMPSTAFCKGVTVTSLPCSERDGFIWVWPGEAEPTELPEFARPPQGFDIHAEIEVEVPVEHGLLMENLLDLAHAPFTHTSTFAKGWPVPDVVKFHTTRMLSGNWNPYPINMAFQPPCMVLSTIGLAQPGKIQRGLTAAQCQNHLHQLHVCLPSKRGHTRLLYRMSMDFMDWTRYVPGIQRFWQYIAGQVLGEDLVLVQGQQERMMKGGDTWNFPVAYDKLAVRYRRWRNQVAAGEGSQQALRQAQGMTAGELFSMDEEEM